MRQTVCCVVLDNILNFPPICIDIIIIIIILYNFKLNYKIKSMINIDPVIMVPHRPDHQKLQNSEENN